MAYKCEDEDFYSKDNWQDTCHCTKLNKDTDPVTIEGNGRCEFIKQESYEKALAIFLFLYVLIVVAICAFWLIIFWRARNRRAYKTSLKVRRPIYMMLSYIVFLPWVFENSISLIYLYWAQVTPPRNDEWTGVTAWTFADGTPIYYSEEVDYAMHFFWWFGFWSFLQLKVFKLWMLRYDYEYGKEMSNIEWRDHLGLRTVEPTSFFIRYRSILGNAFLMFFLQLVILVIVIFIQIFIRLIPGLRDEPEAQEYEQIVIIIIASVEFMTLFWLMHQIRNVNDNFHLSPECKRVFVTGFIGITCWVIGMIVWFVYDDIAYIWVRTGTTILVVTWICVFCYIETLWVLKKLDEDWLLFQKGHIMSQSTMNVNDASSMNQNQNVFKIKWLKLNDVLQTQEGFEAMMRFLVKEFSCENLLCYVELSQYIVAWTPRNSPALHTNNSNKRGYNEVGSEDDHSMTHELQMSMMQHKQNKRSLDEFGMGMNGNIHSPPSSHGHANSRDDQLATAVDQFPYFENPQFDDELGHYEYIMQKYVYDSACLQINISGGLRSQAMQFSPGVDSESILEMINTIRMELWSLMRDSFTRFRSTADYQKLLKQFKNNHDQNQTGNNNHRNNMQQQRNTGMNSPKRPQSMDQFN